MKTKNMEDIKNHPKMFYVYEFWNIIINKPFYVGYGTCRNKRHMDHIRLAIRSKIPLKNNPFINTLRKMIDPCIYEVRYAAFFDDMYSAKDYEIRLIRYYGRKDLNAGLLLNRTNGGDGLGVGLLHPNYGKTLEDIHGEKKAAELKIQFAKQARKNFTGLDRLGEKNSMYGKKRTGLNKGRKYFVDTINPKKGVKRSEEIRFQASLGKYKKEMNAFLLAVELIDKSIKLKDVIKETGLTYSQVWCLKNPNHTVRQYKFKLQNEQSETI